MNNIELIAWKNLVDSKHFYLLQVVSSSFKDIIDIKENLRDWLPAGNGFTKQGETLIFKKEFRDTNAWIEWAKNAPFAIKELDKDGKPFKLKTAVEFVSAPANKSIIIQNIKNDIKPGRTRQNKCGKCNQMGHNRATCKV